MNLGRVLRRTIFGALAAALVAGVARSIGVDGPHALALSWGVLALVLVLSARRALFPEAPPPPVADPVAGRREVDQLAWSMVEHRTHVRGVVINRVGRIAAARLTTRGLDLTRSQDAAAIEALLGPAAWAVLRPDRSRPVLPRALDATLQALERLEPSGPPTADPNRTTRAD